MTSRHRHHHLASTNPIDSAHDECIVQSFDVVDVIAPGTLAYKKLTSWWAKRNAALYNLKYAVEILYII